MMRKSGDRRLDKISRTTTPARNEPSVAIIVVNWNGWRHTLDCLEPGARLRHSNFLAVVVDNAEPHLARLAVSAREMGTDLPPCQHRTMPSARGKVPHA